MDSLRLFVIWLLVLISYIVINPPHGKARVIDSVEIASPAEVNKSFEEENILNSKNDSLLLRRLKEIPNKDKSN